MEQVIVKVETPMAYLCNHDGIDGWIPKSKIENLEEINAEVTNQGIRGGVEVEELIIPEWLAKQKDWL